MSVPYHAWTHRPKAQGGTDPLPVVPFQMPFVRGFFTNKTLTDATAYSLTFLSTTFEPNTGFPDGLLDTLTIVGDEPFFPASSDEDGVRVYGVTPAVNSWLVSYDVNLKIDSGDAFDGQITTFLSFGGWNGVGMPLPSDIQSQEILVAANGAWTHRFSGLAWLDIDIADPLPDNPWDTGAALSIRVRQDSGSSQTISSGGVLIFGLSPEAMQP